MQEQLQPQGPRQQAEPETQSSGPSGSSLSRRRSSSSVDFNVCSANAKMLDQISFSTGQ